MTRFILLSMSLIIAATGLSFAEDTQREPSFYEFADWNHRHPDEDTDIDMYKHHWHNSHLHIGHGGFIEREYLFPGDPMNPKKQGAVLKYIKALNHGTLEAHCITQPTKHEKEQVFVFIIKGDGFVESGGKQYPFTDGSSVFIPAGIDYSFTNTTDVSVQTVIVVEEIAEGFVPLTEIQTGNYHDSIPAKGNHMHWANIWRAIGTKVKFSNPMGLGIVEMAPMELAQPHVHSEGTEEIWCKVGGGDNLLMFGNRLRWHREGEAYLIPPNNKVPHMGMNISDEKAVWLYLGNRYDDSAAAREKAKEIGQTASFEEFAFWNHRHPEVDANINLYMHDWRDSKSFTGHGGFIEQPVLIPGDPTDPARSGAVLKYIKAYNHGILPMGAETEPTKHKKEQAVFIIESGEGRVEAGGKSEEIMHGSGVFIPAELEYKFVNTGKEPLQTVIIVEEIGKDFEPIKEMKVGNYYRSRAGSGMHWAHIGRGIISGAKYYNPMGIAVVSIDAFDMAQPHVHEANTEEIWYQFRGRSLAFFGNTLQWMEQGTAFLVPPDARSVQCSINPSDEPTMFIYFGNRRDRSLPGNEHKRIEGK